MPLVRCSANPILTRADVPPIDTELVDVTSVFNPGAARWRGRDVFLLRVQTRGRETVLLPAERADGGTIRVHKQRASIDGLGASGDRIHHLYDPRLTVLDDTLYAVAAADTDNGCRLVTMQSKDLLHWSTVGFDPSGDRRNGVLFSERINGRYARLERPNVAQTDGSPSSGSEITIAYSDDLRTWEAAGVVMRGRPRYWDELIGAGPPPIKTERGWLLVYHGVATHFASCNIYQAGVCLLDLENPARLIARSKRNILEPREACELVGQVPNVVFPTGAIAEDIDSDGFARLSSGVRVYYGAADTVVAMAESTVATLIADCDAQDDAR